jgi:purine catabolism regulator
MLRHRPVKPEQLESLLAEMNWNVHDTYFCATFVFNLTAANLEKNSVVKIGISNSFSNFNTVYYYYRQTLAAIEQGRENAVRPPRCCYFDDYILDSILRNTFKDMIPEALYPEGFLSMERHDKIKGTNYVGTLEAFLERNMNVAETIKKIYMHRNTLLYRIEKIKELLGMDLDDPDTRLLLRIILKIRKREL